MGAETSQFSPVEALLLLAGVPAMIFLTRRGFLRPGSLGAAPQRRAGLGLAELLAGLAVMLISQWLMVIVLVKVGLFPSESPSIAKTSATAPATAPATGPATRATAAATPPKTQPATEPDEEGPGQAWGFALLVVLEQGMGQLPVVLLVLALSAKKPGGWRELGVVPRRWREELQLGLMSAGAVVPLVFDVINITVVVGLLFHQPIPESAHKLLSAMTRSTSLGATAVMVFSAVVMAPVLEETIFRGLIQTAFLTMMGPRWRGLVVVFAALIFMAVHVGSGVPWQAMPGLFFLGLVLGWLYERSGSLFPGIVVHAGFNAFNTALTLVMASSAR